MEIKEVQLTVREIYSADGQRHKTAVAAVGQELANLAGSNLVKLAQVERDAIDAVCISLAAQYEKAISILNQMYNGESADAENDQVNMAAVR